MVEDKKLQEDLVNEMMKVSKTNHDVMIYMQSLMKCYEDLENENQQLKKQKDDVVEYIKKYLHEHVIDDLPDEESKFEKEGGIPIPNAKEILLRMLGEIE